MAFKVTGGLKIVCGTGKDSVPSRMTPRPLIWVEGYTAELSMVREKLLVLAPMKTASVLLLFDFRTFKVNQVFISETQLARMVGRGWIRVW